MWQWYRYVINIMHLVSYQFSLSKAPKLSQMSLRLLCSKYLYTTYIWLHSSQERLVCKPVQSWWRWIGLSRAADTLHTVSLGRAGLKKRNKKINWLTLAGREEVPKLSDTNHWAIDLGLVPSQFSVSAVSELDELTCGLKTVHSGGPVCAIKQVL